MPKLRLLPLLIASALTAPLAATASPADPNPSDPRSHEKTLAEITVTASPLAEAGEQMIQPTLVLVGAALEDQRRATLGETVERLPGVQSANFGPNVGRPIIRGLDGARVQVTSGGLATLDVSTVSVDHAVTIEPFLAEQIEVLKGPATVLFGSGAIGGVVNVVDGRIATQPVEGVTGRAEIGGNTIDSSSVALAKVAVGNGRFALTADAARRDGDDFRSPFGGRIENTAMTRSAGALGLSFTGANGYAGVAVSRFDNRYGIPFVADDDDAEAPERALRGIAKGGEGKAVALDMTQRRTEARVGWRGLGPLDSLEGSLVRSDYEHVEIELEDNSIGTRFVNDAYEGRLVGEFAAFGAWRSAIGIAFGERDFLALGDEAFVPPAQASEFGLFALLTADYDPWKVEIGGRLDRVDSELKDRSLGQRHDPGNLSLGVSRALAPGWRVNLNLDRAQRAPSLEELFSNGPHAATASFEIGDPSLGLESAQHAETGLHYEAGTFSASLNLYRTRFDDFIYLQDTGEFFEESAPALANKGPDDELPIRQWVQADARFSGFELQASTKIMDNANGGLRLRGFADGVRGRLSQGGNLPRIAPGRFGLGFEWTQGAWRASLDGSRYLKQDRVAVDETPTAGFNRLDAHISYALSGAGAEWEIYADVRNLTDAAGFSHTSFLKDVAPLPGRGVGFGIRAFF